MMDIPKDEELAKNFLVEEFNRFVNEVDALPVDLDTPEIQASIRALNAYGKLLSGLAEIEPDIFWDECGTFNQFLLVKNNFNLKKVWDAYSKIYHRLEHLSVELKKVHGEDSEVSEEAWDRMMKRANSFEWPTL